MPKKILLLLLTNIADIYANKKVIIVAAYAKVTLFNFIRCKNKNKNRVF